MTLASCHSPSRPQNTGAEFVRRSQPLLGTFVVIAGYGTNRAHIDAAATAAFNEIRRVDALLSVHRVDSEAARVNREAATNAVRVSPEFFSILELAQRIARDTDGSFDVTIGPVADLWGFIWKEYRLPTPQELATVLPRVGYRHPQLDPVNRTVRFSAPGVSLDFGGIGKGYAVDRAMTVLHAHGITNVLVRAGGDLRVSGAPPGETAWRVQIEDPEKTGQRTTIPLRDAAVSTSGNYENFFVVDGKRYGHVLDPRTGLPVEGIASCSVIAPTCTESDAWATALMVLGLEKSIERFSAKWPVRFVVDQRGKLVERRAGNFPDNAGEAADQRSLK